MKKVISSLLEDPPQEDSKDFSQEEAQGAILTANAVDLADKVLCQIQGIASKFAVNHELRRREEHIYYRLHLVAPVPRDSLKLVYQIDWVKP